MKVAVLTFPLINNYGGIIQAYALMNLLKEEGHEPVLLNLQNEKFYKSYTKYIIKKYLLSFLGRFKNVTLLRKSAILKEFIDKEITPKTIAVYNASELKKLFKNDEFDACIVGSDQVFAKLGYPNFENMFSLGFVNDSVIKLSYAASFGKGSFSGEIDKINFHKQNLMRFKAVSVREDSAVSVCSELFDIKAQHLIDPTLAINKNYYIEMIEKSDYEPRNLGLFSYVLDVSLEKQEAISKLAETKKVEYPIYF
ncbi:polysaccharide pyruvyl transferase family protein [Pseudoalteromonas phenolica]|uniref:polysaccharide pyruvyl transferase family protein n=1 Tax=Pseudoalteromonas phenolica TaxID=161398 RepID=UPI00240E9010|nr:polysaccharide pyruvyl transferase family protein [Pseudoalteromonas phenolica]